MKRNIYSCVISLFTIFGFLSCDFTDIDPSDFVKDPFEDIDGVASSVTGAYSLMSVRRTLNLAEYIADDLKQGAQAGGAGTDSYSWSYSASVGDHTGFWEHQYKLINMANRILAYGKDVPVYTDEDKDRLNDYLGSAYFMRAYAHFELLRFFSKFDEGESLGIPYVSNPHVLGQPKRDKVSECYAYLYKDLDRAFNMLQNNVSKDIAYASKTTVNALRARIALYEGKYQHAYVYSTDVLRNVSLATATQYEDIWSDKGTAGVIMKLPRAAGQERIGSLFIGQDNSNVFSPSKTYMGIYRDTDIRKKLFFGRGPDRDKNTVDVVMKYIGTPDRIGLNDEKVLRAEEMKLIEIECLAQQGKLSEANAELNKFRAKKISDWTNANYSKDKLIDEILLERRRELAFEGHRFFDLRRYHRDIVRDNPMTVLFSDNHKQILPIPQSELDANGGIPESDQNIGY